MHVSRLVGGMHVRVCMREWVGDGLAYVQVLQTIHWCLELDTTHNWVQHRRPFLGVQCSVRVKLVACRRINMAFY